MNASKLLIFEHATRIHGGLVVLSLNPLVVTLAPSIRNRGIY